MRTALKIALAILLFPMMAHATIYYSDYGSGSDTNNGTSKSTPWKHSPGMLGLTPSNTSTGDGCSANCASTTLNPGDSIILKGGVIWPATTLPWIPSFSGNASTQAYGCAGTGCIRYGNDPTWVSGVVNSVTLTRDLGGCNPASPPTVAFSGGGGSGAAATAVVMPANAAAVEPNLTGLVIQVNMTNQGSGYTSNPTVTISGGGCTGVKAVADIFRAVVDAGGAGGTGTKWQVGYGAGNTQHGPSLVVGVTYNIFDHIEFRNIYQVARNVNGVPDGVITAFIQETNGSGGNNTFSNNYIHGRWSDCMTNTTVCDPSGVQEQGDAAFGLGPYDEAVGNTFQNFDAFFQKTSSNVCGGSGNTTNAPCEFSEFSIAGGGSIHGNYGYGIRWMVHAGASPPIPLLIYNNEFWGVIYDVAGAHENAMYTQMQAGAVYDYNNVFHSTDNGSSNQQQSGNGTIQVFFNNISWNLGGGTPNYGFNGDGNGGNNNLLYFFNNTMLGEGGTRVCTDELFGSFAAKFFGQYQNNHCITSANPFWTQWAGPPSTTDSNAFGGTTTTLINNAQDLQTPTSAASDGYSIGNVFAPSASGNSTVTFAAGGTAANMMALCNTFPSPVLAACLSDILGIARPVSGGWQAGAYQFGGIPPSANQPSCSPGILGGNYTSSVALSITCSVTGGAPVICWRIGATPATNHGSGCAAGSTLYTGPLSVAATELNVEFIAGGTGYSDGSTATYSWTIIGAIPPPSFRGGVSISGGTRIQFR